MANMEFYDAWEEAERQQREAAAEPAASSREPKKKRKLPEPVNATHDPYLLMEESSSNSDAEQEKQEESSSSDSSSTEDTSSADGAVPDLETKKNSPSESKASGVKGAETKFDDDVPLKVIVMASREQDVKCQSKKGEEEQQEVKEENEAEKKSAILSEEQKLDSEKLLEGLTDALLVAAADSQKEKEVKVAGSHGKWGKPPGPVPTQPEELAPASAKCGATPKGMPAVPSPWRRNDVTVTVEPMASAPAPPLPPPTGPPPVDGSERPRSPSQPPRDNRPRGPAGPRNEGYYYTFFQSRREYERLVRNQFRSRRGRNQGRL